ncbi:MAG: ribose 5-phosphate isomerase B [Tenuifilum sp.]|jgi:ribose 5-phosphate isomerase B|uniref:ribose 5-phosphate isomerase B n=1 Tax=Tenuifilum TaxID=2760873 RepID=UPI001B4A5994|nr:ribose 5-phosphate isomerase B [Bacteroidales bacterium]HOK61687.1 ribose 5-phosphate isomerase B [Tenuifilum sp.]HOK86705.1 ribose 5-phosphate isomerase B [Tenuifilum sp.]HON71673.1 ribose 5-phosphate isomerase B [Tenuifilum sp.]HPP90814.1 ribose 5-phosphate isomerase B [Tenuifilum sp.]
MSKPTLAIASDHAGYSTKEELKKYLAELGYNVWDFGTHSDDSVDYPDFAHPLATAIEKGDYQLGILLCGSGNGVSITANKHQGVRSALCWLPEIATLARQHNDANVCAIPARFVSVSEAKQIVKAFLDAKFEGGRHTRRVEKIPVK